LTIKIYALNILDIHRSKFFNKWSLKYFEWPLVF